MQAEKNACGQYLRTLRYLSFAQIWARVEYRLRTVYYASPLYRLPVERPLPEQLAVQPTHLWAGSKKEGKDICLNTFSFVGRTIAMGKTVRWLPSEASHLWVYNLHYFEWLAHLRALEENGVEDARRLVCDWIDTCGTFHHITWHPYPLSLRLISWLTHGSWLLTGASEAFKEKFFTSLLQQADHLPKVLEWDVGGNHLIKNLKAVMFAGLCLPNRFAVFQEAFVLLQEQMQKQILPDGMHYELSPSYHADVLKDLLDIHALLKKAGQPVPRSLDETLDRMATALAFFRYPDQKLGLFNDGETGSAKHIAELIKRCGGVAENDIPVHLPNAGYARLHKAETILLFDGGYCCPDDLPAHAHADTLSFELCLGAERLLVNSGTYAYQHGLRNTLRGTAAHNTVTIDGENSAEVWGAFRVGRRPTRVGCRVKTEEGVGIGVESFHNGYRHLGVTHRRTVFVAETGTDIIGEDVLESRRPKVHEALVHFHLHPSVTCTVKSDTEALLETQAGKKVQFRISGGRLHEAKSQYAPNFGEMHSSRKLVVTGRWKEKEKTCTIRWALKVAE